MTRHEELDHTLTQDRPRGRRLYLVLIAMGSLGLLLIVWVGIPEWVLQSLSGPRPMFTEWRQGGRGPGYRRNRLVDANRRYFVYDSELNQAALVMPNGVGEILEFKTSSRAATIRLVNGTTWHFEPIPNVLQIAYGAGHTRNFAVRPGFVKRVVQSLPRREGGFEGDIGVLLLEYYSGSELEELEKLLGD